MRAVLPVLMATLLFLSGCTKNHQQADFPEPESLPAIQLREKPPETVLFGEPIELQVRVSASERLALPPPETWIAAPVELLEETSEEVQTESGWQRDFHLTLAVYAVTNTPVFVSTPLVETPEISLPFAALEVISRLDAESAPAPKFGSDEMPDFRGPEALRRRNRNLWISAGGLLLLVLFLSYLAWKWRHRVIPPPPPVPAHLTAIKALEELEKDPIWTEPNVDASATALSLILRTYIEDRFGIQAPDLTTEEFLITVEKESPWSEPEQTGLQRFFTATDRIKFAGDRPRQEVLEELMASVRSFIEVTREEPAA